MKNEIEKRLEDVGGRLDVEVDSSKQDDLRMRVMRGFSEAIREDKRIVFDWNHYTPRLAAALFITAALIGAGWFLIGDGGPTTAYAQVLQVIEKSKQAHWVQQTTSDPSTYLSLMQFQPTRSYNRFPDGRIISHWTDKNRYFEYAPSTNTLDITYRLPDPSANATGLFDLFSQQVKKNSLSWQKEEGEDANGNAIWLFSCIFEKVEIGGYKNLRLTVDPTTERVTRVAGTLFSGNRLPLHSLDMAFEYPETGPADVYEFGVPRDAIVNDYMPSERLFEHNQMRIEATLAGFADAYRTVTVNHSSYGVGIRVFYRQGRRVREDRYRHIETEEVLKIFADADRPQLGEADRWIQEQEESGNAPTSKSVTIEDDLANLSMDGVEYHTWHMENVHQHLRHKTTERIEGDHFIITRYTAPLMYRGKTSSIKYPRVQTHRYDLSRGGAAIEFRSEEKSQFSWLDDANWMGEPAASDYDPTYHYIFTRKVTESKQSPTGQWYSTRIEGWGKRYNQPEKIISTISIFVDFDVEEFEAGFFDDAEKP